MPRTRIDLLPYTQVTCAGGVWYQDVKFAAPVGQAVRAVVVFDVKTAASVASTLHLITAPERAWDDGDWASAGSKVLSTSDTGGFAFEAGTLGDYVRLKVVGTTTSTVTLGAAALYLETEK
jgi:hypothetical protein